MKSFKNYISEAYESGPNGGYGLSKDSSGDKIELDDVHRFAEDSQILQRLNAFIGSVAEREHMSVSAALTQIGRHVEQVGIEFDTQAMEEESVGDTGSSDLPISQFGGRFGKDLEGNDLDDDFVSKDGRPELNLHVEWEKQPNNLFKVVAQVQ